MDLYVIRQARGPLHVHILFIFIADSIATWPEIVNALPPGSHWTHHPDIIARVFWLKLNSMMLDIVDHSLFGKVAAFVWRIEWHARGLPHAHILIILQTPLINMATAQMYFKLVLL